MDLRKLERAKGNLRDSPEKREEVRAISVLAGIFLGSAIGVPTSIVLGLLGSPGSAPPAYDFIWSWTYISSFFSFSTLFGCMIAFATCVYFWRKEGKVNLAHCALSSFTLFGLWIYLLILFTFLFGPLNDLLLQYLSPVSVFWYVALAFFPFMIIIAYISFPSLRPRIGHQLGRLVTRELWSEVRRNPKKHKKSLFLFTALIIIIVIDILRVMYK